MRIGMILDKTFPPDPRVENEAVSLVNAGHQVFLFCLGYQKFPAKEIIKGIEVRRYKSNKLQYKLSALAYTFPFYTDIMSRKIKHFLRENSIEAIHIHDMQIAEAVFKVNTMLKLPIILDLHENRPEIMKTYPHLQKGLGRYLIFPTNWKKAEERFIKKTTKIIVVTNEAKEEILCRTNVNINKIVVVPNTVRKSFYENYQIDSCITQRYKNQFVVLYIGDTGLRRGLQTAIESIIILKNKIPKLKLVIVGENSTDLVLKNQVKSLGVENYVDFQGWQNQNLFPSYIASSAVCISPLHINKHHDTTYANKLFQYMSFGKPVLVSNAIAQKNLVDKINSGLVHEEKNAQDFAEKILKLYNNKAFAENLGANGKAFIKNEFHWEKAASKLIDLYNNLSN